jgi:hypothetical protein
LNSDRLLNTGFQPQFGVSIAIEEIIEVFESGLLKDEDKYYNIKTMNNLINP